MLVVNADTEKFISPIAVYIISWLQLLKSTLTENSAGLPSQATLVFEENIDIELKSFRVNLDD